MNIKALLKDPLNYTLQHWYQPDSATDNDLLERASAVELASEAIGHTRSELQLCANQLQANSDEEIQPLLESKYHSIQEQLQTLKHDRRQHVQALLSDFRNLQKQIAIPNLYITEREETPEPLTISIEIANKGHRDEWNEYIQKHQKATTYHYFGWKECCEQIQNGKSFYFIARNVQQQIVGVLPIIEQKRNGKLCGVSLPHSDFGGALADAPDVAKRLYWRAGELAKQRKWLYIEYKTSHGKMPWLMKNETIVTLVITPDNRTQLQKQLSKDTVTNIDRLNIHNPTLHYGRSDLLNNFHAIYTHSSRTHGHPVLPKKFFAHILESIPNSLLVVGKVRNNPVTAAIIIQHEELLEIRWMVSSWPTYSTALKDWLHKEIMLHAIETNISYIKCSQDTHVSSEGGLDTDESAWPAKTLKTHWHYWLNKGVELDDILNNQREKPGLFRRLIGRVVNQ